MYDRHCCTYTHTVDLDQRMPGGVEESMDERMPGGVEKNMDGKEVWRFRGEEPWCSASWDTW